MLEKTEERFRNMTQISGNYKRGEKSMTEEPDVLTAKLGNESSILVTSHYTEVTF